MTGLNEILVPQFERRGRFLHAVEHDDCVGLFKRVRVRGADSIFDGGEQIPAAQAREAEPLGFAVHHALDEVRHFYDECEESPVVETFHVDEVAEGVEQFPFERLLALVYTVLFFCYYVVYG